MEKFPKSPNSDKKIEGKDVKQKLEEVNSELTQIMESGLKDPDLIVRNVAEACDEILDMDGLPLSVAPAFTRVSEYSEKHLDEWGRILLNAARSAKGRDKIKYAITVKRLGLFVTPQRHSQMFKNIMSNEASIDELIKEGEKEAGLRAGE